MLTNGKKVWGIWDNTFGMFVSNKTTGIVEIFDDIKVAESHVASVYHMREAHEVRLITEGHGSNVPGAYPSSMETMADSQIKTVG